MISVDARWIAELKKVDRGLYVGYSDEFSRMKIMHKDDRTGLERMVMYVQDPDGNPCDINDNLIQYLKKAVEWDRIGKYTEPDDIWKSIVKDMEQYKAKKDLERRGAIVDFNREHRKEWKVAMDKSMQDKGVADYLKREAAKNWAKRKISNI